VSAIRDPLADHLLSLACELQRARARLETNSFL
jgi:hypothetical protein